MSARLVEALRELVACKDLKDEESRMRQRRECRRLHGSVDMRRKVDAMRDEYNRRKPLAWAEARAALAEAEQPAATEDDARAAWLSHRCESVHLRYAPNEHAEWNFIEGFLHGARHAARCTPTTREGLNAEAEQL